MALAELLLLFVVRARVCVSRQKDEKEKQTIKSMPDDMVSEKRGRPGQGPGRRTYVEAVRVRRVMMGLGSCSEEFGLWLL